jgi:hypothetical protein
MKDKGTDLNKSIAEIEGWQWRGSIPNSESSGLEKRFFKLHNTKIKNLNPEDIELYVEQHYGLEHVIPIAISLLDKNILTGSDYEGSLLANLLTVPKEYWLMYESQKDTLSSYILKNHKLLKELDTTDEIKEALEVDDFLTLTRRSL